MGKGKGEEEQGRRYMRRRNRVRGAVEERKGRKDEKKKVKQDNEKRVGRGREEKGGN
jgi:hypothetical protein